MLPISSIIGIALVIVLYALIIFCFIPEARKIYRLSLYSVVFICLFFPDIEYINLPFGLKVNIQTYATMLCGAELVEMYTKHIIEKKKKQGKKLSKKIEKIYESL